MDTTNRVEIDEKKALDLLVRRVEKSSKEYSSIVTIGRGGLSVAQKLSYALDLPVHIVSFAEGLRHLTSTDLFVDDIVCTGDTISCIPRSVDIATLVHRKSALYKPTFSGLTYEGDEYIKFSWEVV